MHFCQKCVCMYVKSQDYGDVSIAGAQQGRRLGDGGVTVACSTHADRRSPNDVSVCGTATVIDSADLRPALPLAAADGLMRSTR